MRKAKVLVLFLAIAAATWLAPTARGDAPNPGDLTGLGKVEVFNITQETSSVPLRAKIQRGQTVLWANSSQDPISIIFMGGNRLQRACIASSGFHLTETGWYTAANVTPGGTASLCFVETGTYAFQVAGLEQDGVEYSPPITGQIIVQ